MAYWQNTDALASALMSAEPNADIYLESTSSGRNHMFYELCMDAQKNKGDFNFIFFPWYQNKDYYALQDEEAVWSKDWLRYQKLYELSDAQLSWAYNQNLILAKHTGEAPDSGPSVKFRQEFPASIDDAFVYSGDKNYLIDALALDSKVLEVGPDNITGKLIFGIDIARDCDYSVIIDRQGDYLGFNIHEKLKVHNTMEVAYWIIKKIEKYNPDSIFMDYGGHGAGVYDRIKELGWAHKIQLVNFGSSPKDKRKYFNCRAEIWGSLRDAILDKLYLKKNTELIRQLLAVKYSFNSKGQMQLESKYKAQNRISSSLDSGDAAALTFTPLENNTVKILNIHNFQSDYDPLDDSNI